MTRRRFVLASLGLPPASGSRVNTGKAFADFTLSPAIQGVIRAFDVNTSGQPLFVPIAGQREEAVGQ